MDLTVVAVPGFFASMEAERRALKRRAVESGPSAGDYERNDTRTSLTMGTLSLVVPFVMPKLLAPLVPGRGRAGKVLIGVAATAAAAATASDALIRRRRHSHGDGPEAPTTFDTVAEAVSSVAGPVAVVAGGLAVTTSLAVLTTPARVWRRRVLPDLGSNPATFAAAVLGWDFIYYWNHRFMHEARYMWAVHVVHHSSERYNLSTALRQPVADWLGTFVPHSLVCLFGIRPSMVQHARGVNLIYQYWIHTDLIRSLGPGEEVLNTPSHHRVHHGSNRPYLDRNHGSILIVWDRLFGTFRRETEPVVYGLTKNIETYNPLRVAFHEHAAILRDVSKARTWRDRLGYVVRHPGWRPSSAVSS